MSLEKATKWLEKFGLKKNIKLFEASSATVELAAEALGCEGSRIAKTLSFAVGDSSILIVAAGDAKIDNTAYKAEFSAKATMLAYDEVEKKIGHAVGGVCPFGVNEGVEIYLDVSLKRFEIVYPACGSSNSAVEMSIEQLETACPSAKWVNVCKGWQAQ